ncbi:hypothetical protein KBB68_04300 [Candidatus Babeliales bacterium]|nr:hypothetical protein [Candidatus Babeliales bacterium]
MKKIIFTFNNLLNTYVTEEQFFTKIYQLDSVKKMLDVVDHWQVDIKNIDSLDELTVEGIAFEYMSSLKQLWIWPAFLIKKQKYKKFSIMKKFSKYNEMYEDYYDKRWQEIPKIKILIQDWEFLQQKWVAVKEKKSKYLIFILDDFGDLDKIDLIGKDELSEQDLNDIRIEHAKYLKYKIAYKKYTKSRSDITDNLWYGPESSEYEADWQKFLDEPLD